MSIQQRLKDEVAKEWASLRQFQQAVEKTDPDARGVSYASVHAYVEGKEEVDPPLSFLRVAADLFGVRLGWLTTGVGPRTDDDGELDQISHDALGALSHGGWNADLEAALERSLGGPILPVGRAFVAYHWRQVREAYRPGSSNLGLYGEDPVDTPPPPGQPDDLAVLELFAKAIAAPLTALGFERPIDRFSTVQQLTDYVIEIVPAVTRVLEYPSIGLGPQAPVPFPNSDDPTDDEANDA